MQESKSSNYVRKIAVVALTSLALIWAIVRVGPATLPDLVGYVDRFSVWQDPNLPAGISYIRENLIHILIYQQLGERGINTYMIQWAVTTAIALLLLSLWYSDSAGPGRRSLGIRLAFLSPVVAVLFGFIGSYDPITVIGAVGLLFAWRNKSRILALGAGVLLGFQHWSQALLMVVTLCIVMWALSRESPWFDRGRILWWSPIGVILGKGLSFLVLWLVSGSVSGNRLSYFGSEEMRSAVITSINHFPILLFSIFAGAWVIVAKVMIALNRTSLIVITASLVACMALAFALTDQSRIFILIVLPSLALMTRWVLENPSTTGRDLKLIEVLAWVLTPVLVWTSSLGLGYVQYTGALDQMIMFVQQVMSY